MSWALLYPILFLFFFATGAAFTSLARAVAPRLGAVDRPAGRKDHARPTPVNGGWAIFAALCVAVVAGLAAPALAEILPSALVGPEGGGSAGEYVSPRADLRNLAGVRFQLLALFAGAAFIFLIGAVDDVRPLGPRFKLACQFVATLPPILAGLGATGFLPAPVAAVATAIWAVTLMNAFNFMDNMDGVCATVSGVIAVVLAVAAAAGGERLLPALFLVPAGALAGFLLFNFHPASIFLGDSGALLIGYLLAFFSTMTTYEASREATGLAILIPVAVMGVPLFDTASVMLIRWSRGAPLMVGDRNHFAHRLRDMGLGVRATCLTIGLLTAATGLLSLALRRLGPGEAAVHLLALAALFGVVATLEFHGRGRGTR